jgi:hypothetical protein
VAAYPPEVAHFLKTAEILSILTILTTADISNLGCEILETA